MGGCRCFAKGGCQALTTLEEKCKIIDELINKGLRCEVAKSEVSRADPWSGIWLRLTDHKFHPWNDILMANFFEQIYAKTGMIWVALSRGKTGVTVSLHDSTQLDACDKDGTPWEDTPYRAKCPQCGETKSFDLMRYDPRDYRGFHCPKCNYQGYVPDFWASVPK